MKILINGEEKEITAGYNVAQLLEELQLQDKLVAVELNCRIIPKSRHIVTLLKDDDEIEIIHAIGGG